MLDRPTQNDRKQTTEPGKSCFSTPSVWMQVAALYFDKVVLFVSVDVTSPPVGAVEPLNS